MLIGKIPKDFDLTTNATPAQIRKLFRNARIIGRRFKLVHIIFNREIIEVATFRGSVVDGGSNQQINERGILIRDNVYGTIDEDAWRRDFTLNALYYNIADSSLIDFTGGTQDIRNKVIRIIGDPVIRYQEDPVRMLRAVRFSAKLDFIIEPQTANAIDKLHHLIQHVSGARLFDEILKLYQCGAMESAYNLLTKHGLFAQLFVQTVTESDISITNEFITLAMQNTDSRVRHNQPVAPAFLFAILLWFPLKRYTLKAKETEKIPVLTALENSMLTVIQEQNKIILIPRRFTQSMREIWLLQFLFPKRTGARVYNTLHHPRFRAAYDFLVLRSLVGDAPIELAQWWTAFQEATEQKQALMLEKIRKSTVSHATKQ